ncbi:MAG: hypothetical protein AAF194_04850, partial [Pseudomonadota bacterium]
AESSSRVTPVFQPLIVKNGPSKPIIHNLYLQNGLLATSGLYLVYAVLAGVAWRQWSKNLSSAQ